MGKLALPSAARQRESPLRQLDQSAEPERGTERDTEPRSLHLVSPESTTRASVESARAALRPWSARDNLAVLENLDVHAKEVRAPGEREAHRGTGRQAKREKPDSDAIGAAVPGRQQQEQRHHQQADKTTSKAHGKQQVTQKETAADKLVREIHRQTHRTTDRETHREAERARRVATKQAQRDYEERKATRERIERDAERHRDRHRDRRRERHRESHRERHREAGGGVTSGKGGRTRRESKRENKSAVRVAQSADDFLKRIRDEHLQWLTQSPLQQNASLGQKETETQSERSATLGSPESPAAAVLSVGAVPASTIERSSSRGSLLPAISPSRHDSSSLDVGHVHVYTG